MQQHHRSGVGGAVRVVHPGQAHRSKSDRPAGFEVAGATGSEVTADGAGLVERPDDAPLRRRWRRAAAIADGAIVVVAAVAADVAVCADDDVIAADPVGVDACSVVEHDAAASATTTVARINERRGRAVRISRHASAKDLLGARTPTERSPICSGAGRDAVTPATIRTRDSGLQSVPAVRSLLTCPPTSPPRILMPSVISEVELAA